jgi:hypothetical protein
MPKDPESIDYWAYLAYFPTAFERRRFQSETEFVQETARSKRGHRHPGPITVNLALPHRTEHRQKLARKAGGRWVVSHASQAARHVILWRKAESNHGWVAQGLHFYHPRVHYRNNKVINPGVRSSVGSPIHYSYSDGLSHGPHLLAQINSPILDECTG